MIMYGDIRAGMIARAVGLPNPPVAWKWSCGFYPGSQPGEIKEGTADTFDQARVAFKEPWRDFLAKRTPADFKKWTNATSPLQNKPPATKAKRFRTDDE